ncbi:hypothetical protein [Desulfomonile tiedjei]|uniref:SCP2 domain-containing protein n=1 Tax=Desulfomonile tiedjei (strain ATCC 49306 / DSM 6799 / DCB-1) TaxID=706587 RepID=I4C670_DESTA|nr:hypothetical protein [Desulfomonile tiedjei]AFM25061.1 hypothetical protein Desti_2377 [Desulfomonile tiedjei DSM 6799]
MNLLDDILDRVFSGATDEFLELLLKIMGFGFTMSNSPLNPVPALDGYQKHIETFNGRYLFQAQEGVATSVIFHRGQMDVLDDPINDWDLKVTFKDNQALWKFLLSVKHDAMDAIFKNDVETEGNLNYLFKFGFMVRDLCQRLGVSSLA